MKIGIIGLLAAAFVFFSSCEKERIKGTGPVITEERNINNFTSIGMAGSTNVTVQQGSTFKVVVQGYSNLLPYFETRVINGTLTMGYKDHVNVKNDNTEVTVTLPVLNALSIGGSGNITSTGDFAGNKEFRATVTGSGDIRIEKGSAEDFSAAIAGSGNVHAFGFTSKKATIHISGSGDAKITATEKLNVKISGSGNVYYMGSPDVSSTIHGSGGVVKQ